jgi:hypothetical protein
MVMIEAILLSLINLITYIFHLTFISGIIIVLYIDRMNKEVVFAGLNNAR